MKWVSKPGLGFTVLFSKCGSSAALCLNRVQYFAASSQKQPQEMICQKLILKNLLKFTGKQLCPNLFFNEVAGLKLPTLLKKDYDTGIFLWILQNS